MSKAKNRHRKKKTFTCPPDPAILDWYFRPITAIVRREACLEPLCPIEEVKPLFMNPHWK